MLLITVASLATQVTIKWTKPTKPYGGADYERLNLGFRALKQGVPYEVEPIFYDYAKELQSNTTLQVTMLSNP